jgi:hypothetical protein
MPEQFRPIGELDDGVTGVVIERRDPARWQGALADAVDLAIDDAEPVYLVEDGKRVAVITPVADPQ